MHVEEVFVDDVIWVKFSRKENPTPCRVILINTDNVITASFFGDDGKEQVARIYDEFIIKIDPGENRDPNGRRVIVYCND